MRTFENLIVAAFVAAAALAAADGCSSSSSASACTAGATEACTGAGGCAGEETCNAAGTAYGACECAVTTEDAGGGKDSGKGAADSGSGSGSSGETPAEFVAKCTGTYACTGGAMPATVTLMAAGGMCTVTFSGHTGDLLANGTVMDGAFDVGTWSLSPDGVVTVVLLGATNICTPS